MADHSKMLDGLEEEVAGNTRRRVGKSDSQGICNLILCLSENNPKVSPLFQINPVIFTRMTFQASCISFLQSQNLF